MVRAPSGAPGPRWARTLCLSQPWWMVELSGFESLTSHAKAWTALRSLAIRLAGGACRQALAEVDAVRGTGGAHIDAQLGKTLSARADISTSAALESLLAQDDRY